MGLYQKIYEDLKPVIEGWEDDDIYAISFFVYDLDDDPDMPTVTIGYNTLSHWEASIEKASDEAEAKWNYAF